MQRFKLGFRGKTTLLLGGLISFVLIVISLASYWQSKSIVEHKALELEQNKAFVFKQAIEQDLANHQQNLLALRDVPSIQSLIRARANDGVDSESGNTLNEWRHRLEVTFSAFLANHRDYQQLRYISADGDELVRVQRTQHGEVSVVAQNELQNKYREFYVSETLQLKAAEIFYSNVSLNREHNVIQVPHLPVLRMATPVVDDDAQVSGVMVINLATERLFDRISSVTGGAQRSVVDHRGYYIKHADDSKTFGFDLNFDDRLRTVAPMLSSVAQHRDQFIRVNEDHNVLEGFQKIFFSPQDRSRYWLLTFHVPEDVVFADIIVSLHTMLISSLVVSLLSMMVVVYFVSKKILKPVGTMAAAYERLMAGDLAVRVDETLVSDEFLTLYSGFNTFAATQQTATVQLRNEVAAQTTKLSAVIDNIVDGIITINDRGMIESFNHSARKIFGYNNDEIIGQNVKMLVPSFRHEKHERYLYQNLKSSQQHVSETEAGSVIGMRKDGTTFPMEWGVGEVSVGKSKHFVGITRDITERSQAEAALFQAKAEAEQANKGKSQFLANMSHELRTPMNAILGMLTLLQKTELTARQADYAAKSDGAARSLLGLLNEILDFSKIEAGKMTLDPHPFALDQLLRDLCVLLSTGMGEKPLEVLFDIAPLVPRQLVGDAMRLQQVLLNLGSNAIKFTEQGEVIVAIEVMQCTDDAVTLQFSVSDSGIGIAPENQAAIFSGFTQAESSTTRRFGGTGLGVVISERFVRLMGGELELHSELGKGSRFFFTLTLPIATQSDAQRERVRDRADGTSWRVLVIDDNPTARELLANMGQSLGWQVDLAQSGEQALQMLQQRARDGIAYQIIFVDWRMPGMDGWQTSQCIRELQAERLQAGDSSEVPALVMISAHGREAFGERTQAEQSLVDAFLVKPVTASMLFDVAMDARTSQGQGPLRPSHVAPRSAQRRLDGMRLLLVEYNLNNQQVACELLEGEGARVQIANHGQEAVALIAAAEPAFDVVLMDLQMPVMDGFAATSAIRNDLGLSQLPIVAMTANAMASDREACLAAGMNDHVGKPFDLDHLVSVLCQQTGRQEVSGSTAAVVAERMLLPAGVSEAAAAAGVDISAALHRLGHNVRLYQRMLGLFVTDLAAMPTQLAGYVGQGEAQSATRLLHTLKGQAGTLGAMALCAEAGHAEKQLAAAPAPADAELALQRVSAAITGAGPALAGLLQALHAGEVPAAASGAVLDTDAVLALLRAISQHLQNADMAATDVMAQLQRHYGAALGEQLQAMDEAISALDFDRALPVCHALINEMTKRQAA
jgi:PAS domain S-box-containing protein